MNTHRRTEGRKKIGGGGGCDVCRHVTWLCRWIETQRQEFQSPALKAVTLSAPHTAAPLSLTSTYLFWRAKEAAVIHQEADEASLSPRRLLFFFFFASRQTLFSKQSVLARTHSEQFSTKDEATTAAAEAATEDTTSIFFTFTLEVSSKERS